MTADRARAVDTQRNAPEVEAAFQVVPREMVAEIIDGELVVQPRPRPRHARVSSRVYGALQGPFDREPKGPDAPGGWIILPEPEVHLGTMPDKLAPDIAGWHRGRLPDELLDEDAPGGITIAPDWVCEVISKGSEQDDRVRKMRIYAREGVGHAWLISRARVLEVYRLHEGHWLLVDTFAGDEKVRAEPFHAIELDLSGLWIW